ncbi:ABC transporter ATP-binding protein [Planktothrix sp. FACHB-1365]|uniref:ABC transporter ATP-binding protein n=1 Tax=Planktothrix sp. FACHB-1365 TaxID=2692855 RepID=UPI00168818E2|nr:ABC transporter ATP-binding protein [Planktothrix sp. FACHB-1365]MBD2482075.1 ABC transporter ATP-binding protein [Planktothrix sp. FACHB-1365]
MAEVILDNIYKSFPTRRQNASEETKSSELQESTPTRQAVLKRVYLQIFDGEFMVLVGPSGCGKSTLLRLIAGLETITGGNIYIGNTLVNELPPKARDIAMVFQNYALYPHLKVYDNLAFGLRRSYRETEPQQPLIVEKTTSTTSFHQQLSVTLGDYQIFAPLWLEDIIVRITRSLSSQFRYISEREKAVSERVLTVAKLLQIESLLDRYPKQLSGGQKQRVALGRAMARNPQVFLMDEPLSNLDAKLRTETRAQIVELQKKLGTTTIYVTHDQVEAMTMGSRIAVMNQGRIQQVAPPLELYNRPANRFVAEFIGSPPMNFIPVQFTAPLLITHPQFRLTLPDIWETVLSSYNNQKLILGIRPEHLIVSCPATKNLPVIVDRLEALGHETLLWVHLLGENNLNSSLQVRIPAETQLVPGEKIWLTITPEKIHLFDPKTDLAIVPGSY